jgi:RNA polymerase sigma factor (sigma-70 family)
MEASALTHAGKVGLLGRSPALLRLQGDQRLVAAIRGHNVAAFEVLFDRHRARLLAFCRGIVGSAEDGEDVLQEVFVAAHAAMLADERPINVKPWLYRIARNRCLNHLRRPVADGQDTMDLLPYCDGASAADTVAGREEIRAIFTDVSELPETQRTALVLREIDDLSYEDIAQAMGTTLPAVKSLLVRARMGLAEASEGRVLTCDDVRLELAEAAEGLRKVCGATRHHIRKCERCSRYRGELHSSTRELAALSPFGLLWAFKHFIAAKLGGGAGSGTAAGSGGAGAGAGGSAGVAGGVGATSGGIGATASSAAIGGSALGGTGTLIGGGAIGAVGVKAAGSFATAALLTAGAVGVGHYAEQHATRISPPPSHVAAAPARYTPVQPAAHHHVVAASSIAAEAPAPIVAPTTTAPTTDTTEPATTDAPATDPPVTDPAPVPYDDTTGADGGTGTTTEGSGTGDDPTASGSSQGDGSSGDPPPIAITPPPDSPPVEPPAPADPPPPADPSPVDPAY